MRKILSILTMALLGSAAYGQSPTFSQGDKVITAGIGFGTALYSGAAYKTGLPPLSANFEIGVADDFLGDGITLGVGPYLGFAGSKYEVTYPTNYGLKYSYTVIGARGALHYTFVDNLDTYGGLMLGYNIVSVKEIGDVPVGFSASSSGLSFSAYIGGRYYFNENLGAMLELGYGVAYVNLGLAFKL